MLPDDNLCQKNLPMVNIYSYVELPLLPFSNGYIIERACHFG